MCVRAERAVNRRLYGGCQFRAICNKPAEHRGAFLKSNYRQELWNPLEVR